MKGEIRREGSKHSDWIGVSGSWSAGKSVLLGDDELTMTDTLRQILGSSLAALTEEESRKP